MYCRYTQHILSFAEKDRYLMHIIDKRDRSALFRQRLRAAMAEREMSQSALARAVSVDRSTISQALAEGQARLPNAQVVGACAQALGVSADWLLGLSERPEQAAAMMDAALSVTDAPRAMVDEQIFAWHREAAGYKIRHVPASLPDFMKTRPMLAWEYTPFLGRTTEQAIGASEDRLDWMRRSDSDYEIAIPVHELECFAGAEGYYAGLSAELRRTQLDHFAELHDQLYPRLRVFLFDARRLFSAPVTVFGPLFAVIYLGRSYIAFRDIERVRAITTHFDGLVRQASISAREFPATLAQLRAKVSA